MNNLLKINKKIIFFLFLFIVFLTLFIILSQQSNNTNIINTQSSNISYDIIDPKFTINNKKEKIAINANEGNFINKDKVLLKNNVTFKSDKFIIKSSEVFFNRKNQTAFSNKNSKFFADNTYINSKGFEITNDGNKIQFNGQNKIIIYK